MKKPKKTELPTVAYAGTWTQAKSPFRDSQYEQDAVAAYFRLHPTLWLVQKGRKRASFTNVEAARAFAGKSGKIRAFVEVQA